MADDRQAPGPVLVAAAGDVHIRPGLETRFGEALQALGSVQAILLAGDLTGQGEVEEAEALARACRLAPAPVVAVLGNHDWHLGHAHEIVAVLREAGVHVLDRETPAFALDGGLLGVAGTKGFVGGFRESHLPDFGEPLLREVYAETGREVDALAAGLEQVSGCEHRAVLLHYAPTSSTLVGEREPIWNLLGSERLAGPIVRDPPDVVFHGHAHAGAPEGRIGAIPVFNVAWPVIGGELAVFDLAAQRSVRSSE